MLKYKIVSTILILTSFALLISDFDIKDLLLYILLTILIKSLAILIGAIGINYWEKVEE